jgi:hypothetical protein
MDFKREDREMVSATCDLELGTWKRKNKIISFSCCFLDWIKKLAFIAISLNSYPTFSL